MTLSRDRDFYKQLLRLTFPIILQHLLKISVDTVNSIMLGSIDQLQMSAVSQANQIFFVYSTVINGFAVGCCVLVSQYWGKRDIDSIARIIAHALRTVFFFGLLLTMLVMSFPSVFMRIYSSDAEIIAIGARYLRKVALMYLAVGISSMIFGASRGMEQVRIVLVTNIFSYAVNILVDYVLIFGRFGFPAMGVDGVAIGTVMARLVELLFCGIFFFREVTIPFTFADLKLYDRDLRNSFYRISFPIVAHELVWSLGTSSGAMITGQLGKSAVAGYNVTTVLYDICASIGNGLSTAASVILGMTLGKGEKEEAKKQASSLVVLFVSIGIVLGIVTFFIKEPFLRIYSLENDAVNYARQFMNVISLIWPFSMLEMATTVAILRSGGDGKFCFYTDIIVMWLICIPLASFCAFRLRAEPWIVVAIIKNIIVLEAIAGIIRVYSYRWVKDLTHDK